MSQFFFYFVEKGSFDVLELILSLIYCAVSTLVRTLEGNSTVFTNCSYFGKRYVVEIVGCTQYLLSGEVEYRVQRAIWEPNGF